VPRGDPPHARERAREADHPVELLLVAPLAPELVVDVLPPSGCVGADRLDVTHWIRADPDVLPRRGDDELADAFEHLGVLDALAALVEVLEAAAAPAACDPRRRRLDPPQPLHPRVLPTTPMVQSHLVAVTCARLSCSTESLGFGSSLFPFPTILP
jgi:hypothetical protein